jgi:hypothetical protein
MSFNVGSHLQLQTTELSRSWPAGFVAASSFFSQHI